MSLTLTRLGAFVTKILINGINGAMGQFVYEQLKQKDDVEIVGFEAQPTDETYIYNNYEEIGQVDAIIDFSHYSIVDQLLEYAIKFSIPTVICTTGLSEQTEQLIKSATKTIPIFKSGNMSLGINVLLELAKIGARSLADFDIEIIEKHHNKKVDAPSGTAFMIADQIKKERESLDFVYGREGNHVKREKTELGIHAIRGGSITGEHTVIFAGIDEVIELKHQATSKAVFAKGAIEASLFILNKQPGLYDMTDLILGGKQ